PRSGARYALIASSQPGLIRGITRAKSAATLRLHCMGAMITCAKPRGLIAASCASFYLNMVATSTAFPSLSQCDKQARGSAMPDAEQAPSEPGQLLTRDSDRKRDNKRRTLLNGLLLGALACTTARGAWAQSLIATPAQTEGPFYPDKLPLDQDNDLIIIDGHKTPAAGEITDLTGRILDLHGNPLRGVAI